MKHSYIYYSHGKNIKKISPKWVDGPFHIVRKISDVNWEITDSKGSHRIYHSNLMMGAGTRKEPIISRTYADTEEVEATYMPRLYEVTIPQLPITSTIQVPDSTRLIFTAPSSCLQTSEKRGDSELCLFSSSNQMH